MTKHRFSHNMKIVLKSIRNKVLYSDHVLVLFDKEVSILISVCLDSQNDTSYMYLTYVYENISELDTFRIIGGGHLRLHS